MFVLDFHLPMTIRPFPIGLSKCFAPFYHPPQLRNTLVLLNLDGTLIDADGLHCDGYMKAIEQMYGDRKHMGVDRRSLMNAIQRGSLKQFLNSKDMNYDALRFLKNTIVQDNKAALLHMMPGAARLIDFIVGNNVSHAVVTNTSSKMVDYFCQRIPHLNKLSNWLTCEDYDEPKPSPDCYKTAVRLFRKTSDKYIIGIENTSIGYDALRGVTRCIYMMMPPAPLYRYDAYLIDDLTRVLK